MADDRSPNDFFGVIWSLPTWGWSSAGMGHPGIEVGFAVWGATEVTGGCVDKISWNASPSPWKIRSSSPRISSWSASLCSGVQKANISTFVNWWTRYRPRVSRPAAPASVRKQCESPTYRFGRSASSKIWSLCIPPRVISAVAIRQRSVSATV